MDYESVYWRSQDNQPICKTRTLALVVDGIPRAELWVQQTSDNKLASAIKMCSGEVLARSVTLSDAAATVEQLYIN